MLQVSSFHSGSVEPIGDSQRALVVERTGEFIRRAERLFARTFPEVPVVFDLRGRTAGMYKVAGRRRWIRYNPWIFGKYFEQNLTGTVPHEVAHFVVDQVYGLARVKPHGGEWRSLMAEFGADDGVTFDLDLDGIPQRRQGRHRYRCSCQTHLVSTTRHNRVMRGRGVYHCVRCRGELVYAP